MPRFGPALEPLEGRRLLSYGTPGPAFQVNQSIEGGQSAPRAATGGRGQVAVIWEDYGADRSGYDVYARRFDSAGSPLGGEFRVHAATDGDQTDPRIAVRYSAYLEDGVIATWRDGGRVFAQGYDAQGTPVGEAEELAGSAGIGADYELVGLPDGGFMIAGAGGVLAYAPDGTPAGQSTPGQGHEGWTVQAADAGSLGLLSFEQAMTTWAETRTREVGGATVHDARIWAQPLDAGGGLAGPALLIAEIQDAATAEEVADLDPVVVRPAGLYGEPLVVWRRPVAAGATFHVQPLTRDPITDEVILSGPSFELETSAPADFASFAWVDGSLAGFFVREDPAGPDVGYFQTFDAYGGLAPGEAVEAPGEAVEAPAVSAETLATLSIVPTLGGDFWVIWGDPHVDPSAGEVHAQRQFTTDSAFHLVSVDEYVQESDGRAVLVVARSGDLSQPASLGYATRSVGSALAGYDYASASGRLAFAAGQAEGTITILIVDDAIAEPFDYFIVDLTAPVGASYDGYEAYISIEDDEPASGSSPVFVDYDAAGLWTYNPVEGWAQLSPSNPESVVSTHRRDAYIDFGAGGLWYWHPQAGWTHLSDVDPQGVKVDDLDGVAYIDFGAGGLWSWSAIDGYRQINTADPQGFLVDHDGLIIDFGAGGLWSWGADGSWLKLNHVDPEAFAGSAADTLYVDFGAGGLWSWSAADGYARISDSDPKSMRLGYDFTNADAYEDVLYIDFGAGGFWRWGEASGWALINVRSPDSFIDDGFRTLYVDFGAGGLWSWSAADGYAKLSDLDPELIALSTLDDGLYIDFGSIGFWRRSRDGDYGRINVVSPAAFTVA